MVMSYSSAAGSISMHSDDAGQGILVAASKLELLIVGSHASDVIEDIVIVEVFRSQGVVSHLGSRWRVPDGDRACVGL